MLSSTKSWRDLPLEQKAQLLARLQERNAAQTETYRAFQARYWGAPDRFVQECFTWRLGQGPTPYQLEILRAIPTRRRVSVRGPHGLGKTTLSSWAILWFALTRDGRDWKCVTTASAWRQLAKFLWPELHKWARRLRWDRIGRQPFNERGELLQLNLKLSTGEAFAVASDNAAYIEGAHADHLLYVFDEAKAIPGAVFDAAEGAFSNAGADTAAQAYALAISTPGEPQGRFYDIHKRAPGLEDWWTRHVTLAETVAAGRVSEEWAGQRERQWGAASAVFQNRVLGEFASADEDGIIPLAWVEAAQDRWRDLFGERGEGLASVDLGDLTAVGVDVGRGGDKTVMAWRYGMVVAELRRHGKADTMETAFLVEGVLEAHPEAKAVIDGIGIGAGVFDWLRKQRRRVESFIASQRSDLRDKSGELGFVNRRAAAWWNMRELLDPANGHDVALPPDDRLTGDLTAPHWQVMAGARIQVEDKVDIKARLGRSTDDADAVVMAFARPEPVKSAPGVIAATKAKGWGG